MRFRETSIKGAYVVEAEPRRDGRGSQTRAYCSRSFAERGLDARVSQCSVSRTAKRSTIRGMHLARAPFEEAKLVRCLTGKIFDVILDLREDSSTFGRWEGFILREDDDRSIYVPNGVAHGFQTLSNDVVMYYQMTTAVSPECSWGVRFDDPYFGISWPLPNPIVSQRDRDFAFFRPTRDSGIVTKESASQSRSLTPLVLDFDEKVAS